MPSSLCLLKEWSPIVMMSIDCQEGEWPPTMTEDLLKPSCHFSKWQQWTSVWTQYSLVEDAHLHLMERFASDFTCRFFNLTDYYSIFQFNLLILKHSLWLSWDKEKWKAQENMGNIQQKYSTLEDDFIAGISPSGQKSNNMDCTEPLEDL